MFLKIGGQPDHGFNEPLGLLSDCHRRIEHFLRVLIALSDQAEGRVLDARERAQLKAAVEYFATAAPRHTADEEESLFPRLERAGDRKAVEVLRHLEGDHGLARSHHEIVDRTVRGWLAKGTLDGHDLRELRESLGRLKSLYDEHIAIEDKQVFPAAARLLSATDISEMGREMAARRSVR
jgi:hemerythrin-like domain-containing protein